MGRLKKGKQRARKEVYFGRRFCPPSLFESESADFRAALPVRRKFDVYGCVGFVGFGSVESCSSGHQRMGVNLID